MSTYLDEIQKELIEDLRDAEFRSEYLQIMKAQGTASFYNAVYWACKAYGVQKVADEVGINRKQITRLRDAGHHPAFETMEKILKVLGMYIVLSDHEQPEEAEAA